MIDHKQQILHIHPAIVVEISRTLRIKPCYTIRGFLWEDGNALDLGTLPGFTRNFPQDINDLNVVVGLLDNWPSGLNIAFVWQGGVIYKLEDLVYPSNSGLTLSNAVAINNLGPSAVISAWGTVPLYCGSTTGASYNGATFPTSISDCFNVFCVGLSGQEWEDCINKCVEAVCQNNPSECE